ncbi:MAG: hypothetical protein AAF573_21640 [Bacteroidota bacterium]
MQGIGEAFQSSRKEKDQGENVSVLLNHSYANSWSSFSTKAKKGFN